VVDFRIGPKIGPSNTNQINGTKPHKQAHVIVCGNEKGGAGKTTTAMHITIGLLLEGHSVASIDLDGHQKSFTHYMSNRHLWNEKTNANLPVSRHFVIERAEHLDSHAQREAYEYEQLSNRLSAIEHEYDYVVIDTPGFHSYLTRLAHGLADTLVTPINESFVDLDMFGNFRGDDLELHAIGSYAEMVLGARAQRKKLDGKHIDWLVVRNRVAQLSSKNHKNIVAALDFLSEQFGFRTAIGISERNIYREFFPMGVTAMDRFSIQNRGDKPTMSHLSARREVKSLLKALHLPRSGVELNAHSAPNMVPDTVAGSNNLIDLF